MHPFMALALQLRAAGHEVSLVTSAWFAPMIEKRGLRCVPIGQPEEYLQALADPRLWDPNRGLEMVLEGMAKGLAPTIDAIEGELKVNEHPKVLVASSLGFGARIVGERHCLPTASIHLSPSLFWSAQDPPLLHSRLGFLKSCPPWLVSAFYRLADFLVDRQHGDAIGKAFESVGYRRVRNLFSTWMHAPNLTVGMFPAWFALPQSDWAQPHFLAGFPLYKEGPATPLPEELEAFLEAGTAPIAFAPGSANTQGHQFFRESAEAIRRIGRRAIFITPACESLPPELPAGVLHVPYAAFELLFPRCAAVVHHGGIGTMAQCFAAGVPQLVMPMAHDQPDNAERAVNLGVARCLPAQRYEARQAAAELAALLAEPSYRARAEEVRARMDAGPDWQGLLDRLVHLRA